MNKKIHEYKCLACGLLFKSVLYDRAYCVNCGEKELERIFEIESENNPVDRPSHYSQGSVEPIDYMKSVMEKDGFEAGCIMNVIKYVSRYKHKNGVEDLKKAQKYLTWAINTAKGEELEK